MSKMTKKGIKKGDYIITDSNYHYPQFKGMVMQCVDVIQENLIAVHSPSIGFFSVNATTFRKATQHEIDYLCHHGS